eukprot:UN05159
MFYWECFINNGLRPLLKCMIEALDTKYHTVCVDIFLSASNHSQTHSSILDQNLLPLLVQLRDSKNLRVRKLATYAILTILENPITLPVVREQGQIMNMIINTSKFGSNKDVRNRAGQIIVNLVKTTEQEGYSRAKKSKTMAL